MEATGDFSFSFASTRPVASYPTSPTSTAAERHTDSALRQVHTSNHADMTTCQHTIITMLQSLQVHCRWTSLCMFQLQQCRKVCTIAGNYKPSTLQLCFPDITHGASAPSSRNCTDGDLSFTCKQMPPASVVDTHTLLHRGTWT